MPPLSPLLSLLLASLAYSLALVLAKTSQGQFFLSTHSHMPHDELVRCTLGVINKYLRDVSGSQASPSGGLCICLDVQARRRPVGTKLGLERLQSLVRVSKKCCLDHFLQTQQARGSAHSSWGSRVLRLLRGLQKITN